LDGDGKGLSIINLTDANLTGAILEGADLTTANLFRTDLSGAHLEGANLSGAIGWTNEQLAQAESLVGATMPDGTVMTEKLGKSSRSAIGREL
jgi:uncharacterized protein YjbI with pentapeptide repeats